MSSLRRILASRANGARSKGPATAAGKNRSSLNALSHGLLAKSVVLDSESADAFRSLLAGFIEHFNPADEVELGMIDEMVAALWRQRRAWAIETSIFNTAVSIQPPSATDDEERARLASAFAGLASQPQLDLIHRYETRLHRIFQRALYNLLLLRSAPSPSGPDESSMSASPLTSGEENGREP